MLTTIEHLPRELCYLILSKLDGVSLGCASGVNHQWWDIVCGLSTGFNIWYRRCLEEFGLDSVIAQTGLTWLATPEGRARALSCRAKWSFWKKLYVANYLSRHVGDPGWQLVMGKTLEGSRIQFVMTLVAHPCSHLDGFGEVWGSSATCSHIWASIGVSGEDSILFGNMESSFFHMRLNADSTTNTAQVKWATKKSVATVTSGGCPGYDLEPSHKQQLVLAGPAFPWKPETTEGPDHIYLCSRGNKVFCVSSLGPYTAVGTDSSQLEGIIVYRLMHKKACVPESHHLRCIPVLRLRGFLWSATSAVDLAHNQVVAGDQFGNVYSWHFPTLCRFDHLADQESSTHENPETMETPTFTINLPCSIRQVLIHKDWVYVLSNYKTGDLHIMHKSNWRRISYFSSSKIRSSFIRNCSSHITCMAVLGDMFVIGFLTGEVLVLDTTQPDWTKKILPHHVVTQFCCPQQQLRTMAFIHGPQGPVLVMGGERVMVYQWRKCQQRNDTGVCTDKQGDLCEDGWCHQPPRTVDLQ